MANMRSISRGSVHHKSILAATEALSLAADIRDEDNDELVQARIDAQHGDCEKLIWMLWPVMRVEAEDAERLGRTVRLDDFQMDLINSILAPKEVASEVMVKGCTGAGKGCSIAMAVAIWYYVHHDGLCILTSVSYDHVKKVLWGEVRRWVKAATVDFPGKLLAEEMYEGEKHYIKLANPETEEGFAGHHTTHVLFVFDEATAVPDARYDITLTQAHCTVAAANPRTLSGWFRRCFPKTNPDETQTVKGRLGPRRLITVDGAHCANVVHNDEKLIPGQIERVRYDALRANPDPRWSAVFAHGRFPTEDPEKQVILASHVVAAQDAWVADSPADCFGLDIAASESGGDETCLAAGGLHGCSALHLTKRADTMSTVGWAISTIRNFYGVELTLGQNPICVDTDGLGKGVADRLAELGCWVVRHVGNATSQTDAKRYGNMRTETYGELGRRLSTEGAWAGEHWMLPHDNLLAEELVAPEKIYSSDGFRFGLTPKDSRGKKDVTTLRDTLGRSPDRADAVGYLYCAVRQIEEYRQHDTSEMQIAYARPEDFLIPTGEAGDKSKEMMHPQARTLLEFLECRGEGFGYDALGREEDRDL